MLYGELIFFPLIHRKAFMHLFAALLLLFSLNASASAANNGFNPNEITYVVTMSANEKTASQIDDFSVIVWFIY